MKKKHKIYIFVAHCIMLIGGMEMYTAGMSKYLESLGWKVYILTPEPSNGKTTIPSLNPYLKIGGDCTFLLKPTYKFKRYEQEQALNFMVKKLNLPNINDCEIIIESCSTPRAFWAELLAAKLNARHFFIASEETYRGKDYHFYEENLDFFYFKLQRNEMTCNKKICKALFNGYKNVTAPLYEIPPTIHEQEPIQDVENFPIDKIPKLDWNICHIGRETKEYFQYVIEGVAELARRHPDKKINFILVGKIIQKRDLIIKTFQGLTNVLLMPMGDMVPIPRSLFSKVDVVCAISQSARFAANEGILTIVGSAENPEKTPGVLGYDTEEQVHGEGTFSYVEALENVLVKRLYDGKTYSLPKLKTAEEYYKNFWTILEKAAPKKEYYTQRLSQERIRDWTAIFPFAGISKGARVILFGATEIAKDYKKQISSQQNSKVEIGRNYIKQFSNTPPPL